MRRRSELVLFLLLVGLLGAGFLLYQGRLGDLDLPRRDPIVVPNPELP